MTTENRRCCFPSARYPKYTPKLDEPGYAQPAENTGNWLCPCVGRDHFEVLLKAVRDTQAKPIDKEAIDALADTKYHNGMIAYGRNYDQLSREVWQEHYMAKEAIHS